MTVSDFPVPGPPEQLLSLFTDSVMDYALCTLDAHGTVASWNHGAERLFGYRADEILGRPCGLFYSQDAHSRQEMERELALAGERGSYELETWRFRKDGRRIGAYVVTTALRDDGGVLRGYVVVTRDITEQRRSIQEIQDQKHRLRSILETAVDAVVIIDEHGAVESINPAGERMFGYAADEVVGQNVSLLMPQPFAAEHTGYIQKYLRTGQAKIIGIGREVQVRRKDGTLFPADLAVSTFRDGKQLFTGILRDISDRKAMEAEVLQIAEAEQRRIGQELHDDAQQQLSALTMIARSAADALASLAATDDRLADVRAKVERVVKGLKDANQSLRGVARGLVPLQVEAHGLPNALANLARQIHESEAANCRFSRDEGLDIADPGIATHLFRIAQEAVNNAMKHASPRQIEIRLRTVERTVALEIVDDGQGITESQSKRGRGLQIMAYRAGLIGGVLTVRPGPAGGTVVSCVLQTMTNAGG